MKEYVQIILIYIFGGCNMQADLPICPVYNETYPSCMQEYTTDCSCFDNDQDGDVDLRDFAIAQNNFYWM